jgi:phosphonate transport system substrate-binding protein
VVSGVVVNSGNARNIEQFARLLSQKTGYPLHVVYASSYIELSNTLRDHPGSLGWACGAPFVEDHKAYGQQLVAVPLFHGQPLYHSLILARKDGKERRLADFRGKVLAYSDIRSNSGFVSPAYALHQQGIDISDQFRLLINAGSHEHSIEALLSGLADVAAVDEYVWVEYLKVHPDAANKLRVVESMGPYPFTPIVAGPAVRPAVLNGLAGTLTSLKSDREGRVLLNNFGLDGFVVEPVSFYAPIQKMLDAIRKPGRDRIDPTH